MSRATAQKQVERREGQKFSAADYSRVQEILDHGELFLAKDRIVIGFTTAEPDRPWRAVLKSTQDGAETYLLTLHRVNRQHLRHARRQFSEVRGE